MELRLAFLTHNYILEVSLYNIRCTADNVGIGSLLHVNNSCFIVLEQTYGTGISKLVIDIMHTT